MNFNNLRYRSSIVPVGRYDYTIESIDVINKSNSVSVVTIKYQLVNGDDKEYNLLSKYAVDDTNDLHQYTTILFGKWLDIMADAYGDDNVIDSNGELNIIYLTATKGSLKVTHNKSKTGQVYANVNINSITPYINEDDDSPLTDDDFDTNEFSDDM